MFGLLWDFLYPFPLSRPVLILCSGSYFLLMGVLTLYTTYKEKVDTLDIHIKWVVLCGKVRF